MKSKKLSLFITTVFLLCAALMANAQDIKEQNTEPNEDVILQWNRVLGQTLQIPNAQPPTILPVRSFAMMHLAMFDAVNSIDRSYTPYLTEVRGTRNASIKAAAAQAAHDVLASLYPNQQAIFAAELSNSLIGISPLQATRGRAIGHTVATRMLANRAGDGWSAPWTPYILPPTPGNWQVVPPSTAAGLTHYPAVLPFIITSPTRFTPNPPPALTSAEYAADLNEVKEIGSATSATRTADQTQVARLWAGFNTPTNVFFIWNNVARTVSIARNTSTVENARLFALLNIAFHDAVQIGFASKFQYGLWRPLTAIRRADEDGNPNTAPDVNWTSLLTNPSYPTYVGNNAALGTSQSTILALLFGRDDIPFQHTWDGAGGAMRSYVGFTAMADEEANSRIYGGIHFRFDNVAGQSLGRNAANYLFLNIMKPRGNN